MEEKTFEFYGKTLVRCGNVVYYGDRDAAKWLRLTILQTAKDEAHNIELATAVLTEVVSTETGKEEVLKATMNRSFYEAFEFGSAWLDRALQGTLS